MICSGVVGAVEISVSGESRCSGDTGECVDEVEENEAARLRRLVPCES